MPNGVIAVMWPSSAPGWIGDANCEVSPGDPEWERAQGLVDVTAKYLESLKGKSLVDLFWGP